jgi:trimeric autotransporter adhesin
VAISGDTIVVGARGEDSNGRGIDGEQSNNALTESGAVYVIVREGTRWKQQAYLKASNSGAGDRFGASVAVSGDAILVGAAGFDYIYGVGGSAEDSNATGINGDQANNGASNSGAAYLFVREGTAWKQTAYLKASNTGVNDYFGRAVALDAGVLAIGAPGEASHTTGINGDQTDDSSPQSGAAYAFGYASSPPKLTLLPDGSGGYFLRVSGDSTQPFELQRADSVLGAWKALATLAPSATGFTEFHEVSPNKEGAFYRVVLP